MRFTDFVYDGIQLSSFGLTMGQIDGSDGVEVESIGSKITFNTVPMHSGKYYSLTSTKYEECLETSFDIFKNPCGSGGLEALTENEIRVLIRWLNRRQFYPFRFVYDAEYDSKYLKTTDASVISGKTYFTRSGSGTVMSPYIYSTASSPSSASLGNYYELNPFVRCYKKTTDTTINPLAVYFTKSGNGSSSTPYDYSVVISPSAASLSTYYEAQGCEYESSFNIEYIKYYDVIYGLRLTMTSNKPFGYGDEIIKLVSNYVRNTDIVIPNISDELYDTPLKINLNLLSSTFADRASGGTLFIKFFPDRSSTEDSSRRIQLNGLAHDEEIMIDGFTKIITTSSNTHKIYNDFNFTYPKLDGIKDISSGKRNLKIQISSNTSGWNGGSPTYCDVKVSYRPIIKGNIF